MSYSSDTRLPLKVMMNKDHTKVLFAEANTDFIDVLLSFLALPLGKVVGKNYISLGSIGTLRTSLYNMDESYFCVGGAKKMLLNPRSQLSDHCRKLKIDVTCSSPNQYYICSDNTCPKYGYRNISVYSNIATCDCGRWLNRELRVGENMLGGAFVTKPSSFVVTDDLRVVPVLTGIFQTLSALGIDIQGAELRSMSFGMWEIRELLKLSLYSSTPLSDMVDKNEIAPSSAAVIAGIGINIMLHHIPKEKLHSREIILKVLLQKSTNKLLYAEATEEFVELLFSFLTLPLGGVEFLSGGNTCFKSIDNLYKSVSNDIVDECFRTPEVKSCLLNPKLPYGCVSKEQFLPLGDEEDDCYPKLYCEMDWEDPRIESMYFNAKGGSLVDSFKWSEELYLKKHSKFIVTDDLTVSPSLSTSILIRRDHGISLSDVKEVELGIGLEEALSILKASLTSKTPLTDALVKPLLNKLPNLERKRKHINLEFLD